MVGKDGSRETEYELYITYRDILWECEMTDVW